MTMPSPGQPEEDAIVASIVRELVPELEYAAPTLVRRFNRGEPLVETIPPSELGFEGGAVDHVLLELFKALVPYVKAALGCGMLTMIQSWRWHERSSRSQAEQAVQLNALVDQKAELRQILESIAGLLARYDGAPVMTNEVVESIAAPTYGGETTNEARPRV
ncbi:MAG TPA: hypothetical protein VFO89_04975 [Thermoanaerobaculia bacterium]|nr:hypothetical protein [Thermoanaerobaculia bacterium]